MFGRNQAHSKVDTPLSAWFQTMANRPEEAIEMHAIFMDASTTKKNMQKLEFSFQIFVSTLWKCSAVLFSVSGTRYSFHHWQSQRRVFSAIELDRKNHCRLRRMSKPEQSRFYWTRDFTWSHVGVSGRVKRYCISLVWLLAMDGYRTSRIYRISWVARTPLKILMVRNYQKRLCGDCTVYIPTPKAFLLLSRWKADHWHWSHFDHQIFGWSYNHESWWKIMALVEYLNTTLCEHHNIHKPFLDI